MIPCDICGKATHIWYDCPKRSTKPDGWKPDRLRNKALAADAQLEGGKRSDQRSGIVAEGPPSAPKASTAPDGGRDKSQAKASKGKAERKRARKPDGDASRPSDTAEVSQGAPAKAASAAIPKRGRGRPRIIEDRRAYKAQKQREYRAKLKEAKPE